MEENNSMEIGYNIIKEKMESLTNDVKTMIEGKEISEVAAQWLLEKFKYVFLLCKDHDEINNGYDIIEEKFEYLVNDVKTMIEKKEISESAAQWLLDEFKYVITTCIEFSSPEDENSNSLHF